MKKKIFSNRIYDTLANTIKKTSLPIFLNKTNLNQINFLNTTYRNHCNSTNKNEINKIDSSKFEIFNDIVGYDDIKKLFIMATNSLEPIHITLAGPPASA